MQDRFSSDGVINLGPQFGPVILLDPFWDVACLDRQSRSPEFRTLVDLLMEKMPLDPLIEEQELEATVASGRWSGSCSAVEGVCRAIAPALEAYMKKFFEKYPDKVPGYELE